MGSLAMELATWVSEYGATTVDCALADRALLDTVSVAVAGRQEPATGHAAVASQAARWAVAAHVLDFDDLHMESTTHISTVCVPAAVGAGEVVDEVVDGDRLCTAYLVGAGVMSRLGVVLGWQHYVDGWHATCTAGAPAAAAAAASVMGLTRDHIATAMALSIPAAGGVQRAFGTDAKSLQIGFAVEAGIRAAQLARSGATADVSAVDAWLDLVGGDGARLDLSGPAVPGGLAVKLYPCCYAMQRPISTVSELMSTHGIRSDRIDRIVVRTPRGTVTPLIHPAPHTGLEGKFSLQYAIATAVLDDYQGFSSFTDSAVNRPAVAEVIDKIDVRLSTEDGDGLLVGEFDVEIHQGGTVVSLSRKFPAGSPAYPATEEQFRHKISDCLQGTTISVSDITWDSAASTLRAALPDDPRI